MSIQRFYLYSSWVAITKTACLLGLCSLLFGLSGLLGRAIANTQDEYSVKIALVRNIALFTQWPEDSFIELSDKINLCIVGDNVVQQAFFKLMDKQVIGRSLNIIDINKRLNLSGCHIVFIGGRDRIQLSKVHVASLGKPILSIDDMTGTHTYSGIVNLQIVDGKVRMNINIEAARKAHLKISSRLLKLATIVSDTTGIE